MTNKSGICRNCKVERRFVLHLQLFGNGSENFLWVCSCCNAKNPGRDAQLYIPSDAVRKHLSAEQITKLPLIMPDFSDRCARCGSRGTERHHWAPKGIFGLDEAELWPKDYLCKSCHDEWHLRVTPQLVK